MNYPHLHLMINHIPVLGSILALLLLTWALVTRRRDFIRLSLFVTLLAGLSVYPAFFTGDEADEQLEDVQGFDHDIVEEHEESADWALWILLGTGAVAALGTLGQPEGPGGATLGRHGGNRGTSVLGVGDCADRVAGWGDPSPGDDGAAVGAAGCLEGGDARFSLHTTAPRPGLSSGPGRVLHDRAQAVAVAAEVGVVHDEALGRNEHAVGAQDAEQPPLGLAGRPWPRALVHEGNEQHAVRPAEIPHHVGDLGQGPGLGPHHAGYRAIPTTACAGCPDPLAGSSIGSARPAGVSG